MLSSEGGKFAPPPTKILPTPLLLDINKLLLGHVTVWANELLQDANLVRVLGALVNLLHINLKNLG